MKPLHFLLTLAALLWSGGVIAAPIGRMQAMNLAEQYVRLDKELELRTARAEIQAKATPAYHIFNDKDQKGFVIISGDDEGMPVLGYARHGRLDARRLPEQLSALLAQYDKRMESLRSARVIPGEPTPTPKPEARVLRGPLLRSLWNQDEPFYNDTPTIGGRHTATGCVATAMAQMMYFHKWPLRGKGSQSYTPQHPEIGQLSVDFSQSAYNWEGMLAEYAYNWVFDGRTEQRRPTWGEDAARAVAKLMFDIGVSVRTGYNLAASGGSGSNMFDAARSFREHFSYRTQSLYRDNVPHRSFLEAIRQELDNGYPVLMAGSHAYAGHAWVIDGYDENGFLHVNWGWGGLSNGYFALSFMSPDKVGTGGDIGGYNQGQMIILIRPEREGSSGFPPALRRLSYPTAWAGMRLERGGSDVRTPLELRLERLGNRLPDALRAEVAVVLRNAEGEELARGQAVGALPVLSSEAEHAPIRVSLSLPTNLPDGTYRLHTMSREVVEGQEPKDWLDVEHDTPILLMLRQGRVELIEAADRSEVALRLTAPAKMATPLWQGGEASIQLSIANPTLHRTAFGEIVMRLSRNGQLIGDVPVENFQFFDRSRYDGLASLSSIQPLRLDAGRYDVEFRFVVLGSPQGAEANNPNVRHGRVYPIANPYGPFQIEVLPRVSKPILELAPDWRSPRGESNSFVINLGGESWQGRTLSREQLANRTMSIGCILINSGESPFDGRIICELEEPITGAKYPLASKNGVRLAAAESGEFAELTIAIPTAAFDAVPVGRRYDLHIYAEAEGRKVDVWAKGVYRRGFVLVASGDEPDTLPVSMIPKEGVLQCYPSPATDIIYVRGISPRSEVQLISLAGEVMLTKRAQSSEVLSLRVGHLPRGVYFLRSGSSVVRLILR